MSAGFAVVMMFSGIVECLTWANAHPDHRMVMRCEAFEHQAPIVSIRPKMRGEHRKVVAE